MGATLLIPEGDSIVALRDDDPKENTTRAIDSTAHATDDHSLLRDLLPDTSNCSVQETTMTDLELPARILMATDLSARCDRALTRAAAMLAHSWPSELTVAHVVSAAEVAQHDRLMSSSPSWRRPQSWDQTLEQVLRADWRPRASARKQIIGTTADAVLQAATDGAADLVVLGVPKDARMDRIQLGSTVDALVRHSRVPVLNVRRRARSAYRHVVVATDFSDPALHALRLAARWSGGSRLTLFHAYTPLGSTLTAGPIANDSWRAAMS